MKINTPILIVIAVVVLVGLFFLFKPKSDSTSLSDQSTVSNEQNVIATKTIIMGPDSFKPNTVTIQKNTKVIFKNEDTVDRWPASAIHPTHGIYPEFDPKRNIKPGESWDFVFDKVGSWKFHDHLLPSLTGTITVVDEPVLDQIVQPNTFELVIASKKLVSGSATIKVNEGEDVTIKITSDEAEEFHVHAYDNSVELEPGKQATLTFKANLSGRFPFELENSKTEIGALEVQPK